MYFAKGVVKKHFFDKNLLKSTEQLKMSYL